MATVNKQGALARDFAEAREVDAREALRHLRNVMSVIRSLAQRTADEAESVEEFRVMFDGRLGAFARVQSAIAREGLAGVDLGTIIGDELLGFGMGVGEGVDLAGAPVRLTPRAAGLVALAVHEFAADLAAGRARPSARVTWSDGEGLDIDWVQAAENARPLPDWVERAIAYELKCRVSEDRAGGELRRRIHLPPDCYVR